MERLLYTDLQSTEPKWSGFKETESIQDPPYVTEKLGYSLNLQQLIKLYSKRRKLLRIKS